jgi:hypothetical protein
LRDGLIVDVGVQATTAPGFYVLAGIGHQWFSGGSLVSRSSSDSVLSWEDPQRGEKRPRLLLALGWRL